MKKLLASVNNSITGILLDFVSDALNIENGEIRNSMTTFLPAIIGGVIHKSNSKQGVENLHSLLTKNNFGEEQLNRLLEIVNEKEALNHWLDSGNELLSAFFGDTRTELKELLNKNQTLSERSTKTLLKFFAPIVINKLAEITQENDLSPERLQKYLKDQKKEVYGKVTGLAAILSASKTNGDISTSEFPSEKFAPETPNGASFNFLKWLLPLLGCIVAIYMIMQRGCGASAEESPVLEESINLETSKEKSNSVAKKNVKDEQTTNTTQLTSTKQKDFAKSFSNSKESKDSKVVLSINESGDIVNSGGSIIYKNGDYSIDKSGDLVDEVGNVLVASTKIPEDMKSKLKKWFASIEEGEEMTFEEMKALFGDMLVRKKGASSTYSLSNIAFNSEDHKIYNYSKAEVMGLAAALKENNKGKVEVQVHTNDGRNSRDNRELSELRANVIRDMLVTLGVNSDQITAKGMGSKDRKLASLEKVDIVVR